MKNRGLPDRSSFFSKKLGVFLAPILVVVSNLLMHYNQEVFWLTIEMVILCQVLTVEPLKCIRSKQNQVVSEVARNLNWAPPFWPPTINSPVCYIFVTSFQVKENINHLHLYAWRGLLRSSKLICTTSRIKKRNSVKIRLSYWPIKRRHFCHKLVPGKVGKRPFDRTLRQG